MHIRSGLQNPRARQALVPPNPAELQSTWRRRAGRAWVTMSSRAEALSGCSKLMFGAMNPSNNVDKNYRVRTITLHTDAGFDIETDIVEKTFVFRNRSTAKGTTRYMSEKNVKPGDTIIIEKISSYEYNMKLKRGES